MRFFGYKHYTLEEKPRCFYVGKGLKGRANSQRSRNHKWHAIVKCYGFRVEICFGPVTNEEACKWEIENIALEKTFNICHDHKKLDSDIGCNFTRGGDGWRAGNIASEETRKKLSDIQRIVQNRPEVKQHQREVQTGKKRSQETREKLSKANKNNPKVSAALIGNSYSWIQI